MTAQVPDRLFWKGREYSLCVLPLNLLFARMQPRPQFESTSTANWRGYRAYWKIEGKKLFLQSISGTLDSGPRRYSFISDEKPQFGFGIERYQKLIAQIEKLPKDDSETRLSTLEWNEAYISDENGFIPKAAALAIDIDSLINISEQPHFAAWYSGLLRCPYGDQLNYVHGGFGSKYTFDLVLQIESGIVKDYWIIDNRPGFQAHEDREKIKNTCFSAIIAATDGDLSGANHPISALNQSSFNYGNKLAEAIRQTIVNHFRRKFVAQTVGDEADLMMRYEYEKAIHAEKRAYMSACTLVSMKDKASDHANMELGLYLKIMEMNLLYLVDTVEFLHRLEIPNDNHLEWALQNLKGMEKLASDEKFELIGFSHGLLRGLTLGKNIGD